MGAPLAWGKLKLTFAFQGGSAGDLHRRKYLYCSFQQGRGIHPKICDRFSQFFFIFYLSIFYLILHRRMKTECTDSECIPVLKYSKCPACCVHRHMHCYFLLVFPLCLRTQQVRYSTKRPEWGGHIMHQSLQTLYTDLMAPGLSWLPGWVYALDNSDLLIDYLSTQRWAFGEFES